MELHIQALTDTGRVRDHNEDRVLLGDNILDEGSQGVEVTLRHTTPYLVAIADGMGGHNAGEVASEMVLILMSQRLRSLEPGLTDNELAKAVESWAIEVHSRVLEEGERLPERKGMGTTLVGVLFYNGLAYYLNAGDSRLYRLRDGYLAQITRDHSLRELAGHDNAPSNIIVNSFGGGAEIFVDFAPVGKKLFDGDVLLLCSDGLSDMLGDDEIEGIMNTSETPVSALAAEANNRGGKDNISVLIIRIASIAEFSQLQLL